MKNIYGSFPRMMLRDAEDTATKMPFHGISNAKGGKKKRKYVHVNKQKTPTYPSFTLCLGDL